MIKEYFTDGLISIAILLSLFRTDLVGINNIINYPEVQEIILGQTAAYLPANFHHIHSSLQSFGNPKHLDFDNSAFNAWFQNLNNGPIFQERRAYDIEAFLVSGSHQNIGEQYHNDQAIVALSDNNNTLTHVTSLSEESDSSFAETELTSSSSERPDITITAIDECCKLPDEATSSIGQTTNKDVHLLANGTFSGCNLTDEDLKLIDILYQQDVDLGVGKEIFDPSFREELEREQELEFIKQQEKQKFQLLAKEREELQKREQKDKWLKKNFKRDGETGEWVQLWSEAGEGTSSHISLPIGDSSGNDDLSLEVALNFLGHMGRTEETNVTRDYTNETQQEPLLMHQDSFSENWNGLVDYLNLTTNSFDDGLNISSSVVPQVCNEMSMISNLGSGQDGHLQRDYLIQNVTLPSSIMDIPAEFNVLTPTDDLNCSMLFQSTNLNSTEDFDLGDLNFFSNLTALQNISTDDVDQADEDEFFQNIQESDNEVIRNQTLAGSMDAIQTLEENQSISTGSLRSDSPFSGLDGTFTDLVGATGGSDYNSNYGDMNDRFSKISRLSESSNDSGFAYQGGFSSPSSTSSSPCAGSPVGSHSGINSSASSNDTEHDPHSTNSMVHHHVAHNHTYNTPPGQTPREVKKYAQKVPSRKGPQSRDQRRAEELKIPFTIEDIIESSVEAFNEMLTAHKLNDAQLTLIRDIRRRGKNKVAAQNCRKRKVSVIFSLADEMTDLQMMRDRLVAERAAMDLEKRKLKEKFGHLYTHIFQSLRDEHGEPYDPNLYSLQQSSDGNVFLVPRNLTTNTKNISTSSSSSSKDSPSSRKRKSFDD
uniref:BZIP domain-containing protein n=1 Tax=Arion vulgaris TaxID=1028688 RepID=A0A0B7AI49_9EUPU